MPQLFESNEQMSQCTKISHTITEQIVTLINNNLTKISMLIPLDEAVQNNGKKDWMYGSKKGLKIAVTTRNVSHQFASHREAFHRLRHILQLLFYRTTNYVTTCTLTDPTKKEETCFVLKWGKKDLKLSEINHRLNFAWHNVKSNFLHTTYLSL